MRYPELPGPAPCRDLPSGLFDMVEWPDAELGLSACQTCTMKVECLKLVDPLRSYFDGIAGGYVWIDGNIKQWSVKETETLEAYLDAIPQGRRRPEVEAIEQDTLTFQPEPEENPRIAEIDHLIANGVSAARIAEQFGLSAAALERYAYRFNRPDLAKLFRAEHKPWLHRNVGDDPENERIKEIERMFAEGKTPKEVTEALGVSANTLRHYCANRNRNDLARQFWNLARRDTKAK